MSIEKMGEHLYEKTILEDGSTCLQRLPKNFLEEKYNPPLEEKPSDIIGLNIIVVDAKPNLFRISPYKLVMPI